MGSPRGSTKRAEAAQPLPRETEALRTGEGKTESALLTWQMDFPVEKSPAHSMSSCTETFLPFASPYNILQNLFSTKLTLPSWRWKGSSRGAARIRRKSGKDAVAELQSSALPVSTAPQHGVFSAQLSFHPCFSLLSMPNMPSPVSQTFPNSSYSLNLFHSNRPYSYSTKEKGKSHQHMPVTGV